MKPPHFSLDSEDEEQMSSVGSHLDPTCACPDYARASSFQAEVLRVIREVEMAHDFEKELEIKKEAARQKTIKEIQDNLKHLRETNRVNNNHVKLNSAVKLPVPMEF
jgi:hypothetical protein